MRHVLPPPRGADLDAARAALLNPHGRLPAPDVPERRAESLDEAAPVVRADLDERGLALLHVAEPFSDDEFGAFGRRLGEPMPETAPEIARFVSRGVVLNLVESLRVEDELLAPFGRNELTIHTEGSRRPPHGQPRIIVLYCVEPGSGTSAQTILVPAAAIRERLSPRDVAVLGATREDVVAGTPTMVRRDGGRDVFSFRDLGDHDYVWDSEYGRDDVEGALRRLLLACYSARPAFGTHWTAGLLVALDNQRWFHGRTRSSGAGPGVDRPRHLKRLRIRATAA